jgi:circadian clock protein KaiC
MVANVLTATEKARTGIHGLDEITFGGLPRARATLVCGGPGCGKTLLAMEFIFHGAAQFNEPGVYVSFEETAEELAQNVASLSYDVEKLARQKKLIIDHIHIDPQEIEETGEYDLEGLFIRLGDAIDSIGAKRIALDTVEVLFGGLSNTALVRMELARLFRWLKDRGLTVIVTGERGDANSLTRFGIEEYVSDCVIVLDNRVKEQISIRRLRILKYRGSVHGTNEYPYLIDEEGISLQAITSLGMDYKVSTERISSGIEGLDAMMGGKGFFRGTSVLVSGTPGTGKSSVGAHFVNAASQRGERCLYFAFEESQNQILRNMASIGLDLSPWIKKGLLRFHSDRPSAHGLEMHLVSLFKRIRQFKPKVVVIDPVTDFMQVGNESEVKAMLTRLVDYLKNHGITAMFTSLTTGGDLEDSMTGVSSLMDTWILLRSQDTGGMRDHGMFILKSRGMAHSNGIRQFRFTEKGIVLQ